MAHSPRPLSPRLAAVVAALPFRPDMRILEIGCGPGGAARAIADRLTTGHILATDRSATAIAQARAGSAEQVAAGRLGLRQVAAEDLALEPGEEPFDLAFAIRVGAFDGRHPASGRRALERLAHVLTPAAELYVDGGDPLRVIQIPR